MSFYFKAFSGFLLIIILAYASYAQTEEQREHLLRLSRVLEEIFMEQKADANQHASLFDLPMRIEFDDGSIAELMSIENGIPLYFVTTNAEGAALIQSDKVYPGGGSGYFISGLGQLLGIWDSGAVYADHPDLAGRITQIDNPTAISDHATHVAGTMIATGIDAAARGMAYEAELNAWDWNNDASEMAAAAAYGLDVSQHSYSTVTGWRYGSYSGNEAWHWFGNVTISETEDYRFGFYDERARVWDEISYYAPNYVIVKSAGNDRGRGPEQPGEAHYVRINNEWTLSTEIREPNGGIDGFDCIARNGNAKNILTVGAVDADGEMTSFSSWGPSDDGRIKPDVVAKGLNVYSTIYHENDDYGSKSGTSMSTPMISGSIGLMLQHQEDLHPGIRLLSSTIRGLILHCADDQIGGAPGPDYIHGWGLMDTHKVIEVMTDNAEADGIHIREFTLKEGMEINIPVRATGDEPLQATIAWTDFPGTPVEPALNPPDPMLVNDLDMRISDAYNNVFYPYILDPSDPAAPASTGDNSRDNVEMVYIESPQANSIYQINISHKGQLFNGSQDFSIIITGNKSVSGVNNPVSITAEADDDKNISIEWVKNPDEHDVMLVWSPDNVFGIPQNGTVYNPGLSMPGGGIVLYRGYHTGFTHENLDAAKQYFYKAYSYNANNNYSTGIGTSATTDCGSITYFPFSENFNATATLPHCWEIIDHEGNGQVWQFGTHNHGLTGTTGNYAFVNSDAYGSGNSQNTDLVTPILDFSAYAEVSLSFTHYFRQYLTTSSSAKLYYSIDGGENWILLEQWTTTTSNPAFFNESVPEVAGQSQVLFKWNYTGSWAWWWNVDDVAIHAILSEPLKPEVYTSAVTNITKSSAISGGVVLADHSEPITERGIVWSTSEFPETGNNDGIAIAGEGLGEFSANLSGLYPSTTYYVRAFATNSAGTAYGMQTSFVTRQDLTLYNITAMAANPEYGEVTGSGFYVGGQAATIAAIPYEGYVFDHWTENGEVVMDGDEPAGETYTFIVVKSRNFLAHFTINTHTITATTNDDDFGAVTGAGVYEHFATATLTATANEGYHFVNWTENGEVVMDGGEPAGETYTFTVVSSRNFLANFAETAEADVPDTKMLDDHLIENGESVCFNALELIITGGDGGFIVEAGAHVELISGSRIRLLAGTHIHEGGFLHARISIDGNFCTEAAEHMAGGPLKDHDREIIHNNDGEFDDFQSETIQRTQENFFTIYPNPTRDAFNIALNQKAGISEALVEVYSAHGRLISRQILATGQSHVISMDYQQAGVYVIRVSFGNEIASKRLVKW